MSFGFTLTEERIGPCGTVYSFRKDGREQSELQAFWSKPSVQSAPDHDALERRLKDRQAGLLHVEWWADDFNLRGNVNIGPPSAWPWLRDESNDRHPTDPAYRAEALWAPIPKPIAQTMSAPMPSLRLYGFQIPDDTRACDAAPSIFIFGNGDVKDVPNPRDKDELWEALTDIRYVMKQLHGRLEFSSPLTISDDGFEFVPASGHTKQDAFHFPS
jgi:hypothetical protein